MFQKISKKEFHQWARTSECITTNLREDAEDGRVLLPGTFVGYSFVRAQLVKSRKWSAEREDNLIIATSDDFSHMFSVVLRVDGDCWKWLHELQENDMVLLHHEDGSTQVCSVFKNSGAIELFEQLGNFSLETGRLYVNPKMYITPLL